jgi:cell division protein FtsI/penicillin-binding protein 2
MRSYCTGERQILAKWTQKIPEDLCRSEKTELTLTLDIGLQRYSETLIEKTIARIERENVTGSAVYIYDPTRAKILAYVGNR